MKGLLAAITCFAVCMFCVSPALAGSAGGYEKTYMGVVINGKLMSFERQPVVKNGRMLVPVRTVCSEIGAKVEWYEDLGKFEISKEGITLEMYIGDEGVKIGDTGKIMDVEPYLQDGTVMVPIRFVAESFGLEVSVDTKNNNAVIGSNIEAPVISRGDDRRAYKVVIDPGHGGYETGAIASGIYEKNLNLDIAKRLNSLLIAEGVETYMTRSDDSYVGLYDRSGLANSLNADLFISVHNNAQSEASVSGSMSLYYPSDSHSKGNLSTKEFASIVQSKLVGALGTKDLGIIQRPNLAVLRTTKMPAVIAEVAYMTNSQELHKLSSSDFKQKAAEALKDAVLAALKKI